MIDFTSSFSGFFQKEILDITRVDYKGNNDIFKITLNNQINILKKYQSTGLEELNRGNIEFKALSHLWKKGFREIPIPINFYPNKNIAIYSYEEGKHLKSTQITREDIKKAANFLAGLHRLKVDPEEFGLASASCLSLYDYLDVINKRLEGIMNQEPVDDAGKKAKKFLHEEVFPEIVKIKKDFLKKTFNTNLKNKLPIKEQVLTPADFGFHNILAKSDGSLVFLDFEYFGRDDPARQILDFLHHDSSREITIKLKQIFLNTYFEQANPSESFKFRLKLLNPLIGVTWVLIYLRILDPKYLARFKRSYKNANELINERLTKAQKKLNEIKVGKNIFNLP